MGILINNQEYNIDQLLNEKIVVTKRKYTDEHPEHVHSTHAPVRNVILKQMYRNNGTITADELLSKGVTNKWIKDNSHLITRKMTNKGIIYIMTERARRLLKTIID